MPRKIVRISLNSGGFPEPDQDPVQIKQHNDQISWCADFPFTIEITGYSDIWHEDGDHDYAHRYTSGIFTEARRYKYSITANGKTNDPIIDVNPSAAEPRRPLTGPETPPDFPPNRRPK